MSTIEQFKAGVPGAYNVPAETYHQLQACSASALKKFARSPLHCREATERPMEPTPAMALGSAVHAAVLERDEFGARYVCAGRCVAHKKSGDRCENDGRALVNGEWRCGVHALSGGGGTADTRTILTVDQWDACVRIRDAVDAHPAARRVMNTVTHRELSAVWRDPATGVLCKMRADCIAGDVCWDLKTTSDATPEEFAWAVRRLRYDFQGAWYPRGLAAVGLPVEGFGFIAVESERPHDIGAYTLDEEAAADADFEIFGDGGLLERYAACLKSGRWHGYSDQLRVLKLPPKRSAVVEV